MYIYYHTCIYVYITNICIHTSTACIHAFIVHTCMQTEKQTDRQAGRQIDTQTEDSRYVERDLI